MTANILLVRHAQARGNISDKIGYVGDDDFLTDEGFVQAKGLARILARYREKYAGVMIHISQANRTLQTAIHAGVVTSSHEFIRTPALDEIAMGAFTGISRREGGEIFHRVLSGAGSFPNGESVMQVQERVKAYLDELDERFLHLCLTHGVAISSLSEIPYRPGNATITPYPLHLRAPIYPDS